ncbi:laminin subunit [Sparganum proliferum]
MDANPLLHFSESVNLTVELGTQFHVNYVYLMFKSPRPHAMVIHKKFSDDSPWTPWAYFSSNCLTYFGMPYEQMHEFSRPDEVVCREEYSTLQPLYDGEVVFSVINGRPGYEDFFQNAALQRWSTASQIRIELKKMHTFGDERNAERDTLLTYYFAVRKLTVGGRCVCNGHGKDCQPISGSGVNHKLICVCDPSHHTTGDNCEMCAPGYRDRPWSPATPDNPNPCRACECNGNSMRCEFNEEEYRRTGSGGVCVSCGNNTHGKHCEFCLPGHYPRPERPAVCVPCNCDPIGTVEGDLQRCSEEGQCRCKPGVGGKRCDRCLPDHYGFTPSGCQPCDCNPDGSLDGKPQCDPVTGECLCKENVIGRKCDSCKPGRFGLMANDPLGCKRCYCHGHSSDCSLGMLVDGKLVPSEETALQPYVDKEKVIFSCPANTSQCDVCLKDDKETLDIPCTQNEKGQLECLCREDLNECSFCVSQAFRRPQEEIRREICQCPSQFQGSSCEECAVGYRREPIGGPKTSICIPCTCNNRATTCHPETGECDCQYNTGGLFCDRCKDGFYGDPKAEPGTPEACQPCPCPEGAKCVQTKWPLETTSVVCTDCPDNRTGIRCERCAENFYGNPVKGIPCRACECSGNTDLRALGNCDHVTGECKKCLFGTSGPHCERCLPGYRRNIKATNLTGLVVPEVSVTPGGLETAYARGCQPCHCDPLGTLAVSGTQQIGACDQETGQCTCKSGVTGLRCDKCRPGFFGFESGKGCKECGCSPSGARSEACDARTGVCDCLPFTTGRACDECQPGYYNLSAGVGCTDCACHPYGSLHAQCNENGQCPCRPFASGDKCDECPENRYNLNAGCLPCPPCYNLIQKRVHELREKLANLFGGDGPDSSGDQSALNDRIMALNQTVQQMYKEALDNSGVKSAIKNVNDFSGMLTELSKRTDELQQEMDGYVRHRPACMKPELIERLNALAREIDSLERRMKTEAQDALDEFERKMDSGIRDVTLTEQARNSTLAVQQLKAEMERVKTPVQEADALFRSVVYNAEDTEKESLEAFTRLNEDFTRLMDLLHRQRNRMSEQLKAIDRLILDLRERLNKLREEIGRVPDVSSELAKMEGSMQEWAGALNQSETLAAELNAETSITEEHIEKMKQLRGRLRSAVARQQPAAGEKDRVIKMLEDLANTSLTAIQEAQEAVDNANQKLDKIQTFKEYVARTKKELQAMDTVKEDTRRDLETLESDVQGIHNQVSKAFDEAKELTEAVKRHGDEINKIKEATKAQLKETERLEQQKNTIADRTYREVQPKLEKSNSQLEETEPGAKEIVDQGKKTSREVEALTNDVLSLLRRMNELKDKITKTGPELGADTDGATRFKAIKEEGVRMDIDRRLEKLKALSKSRSNEIAYLKYELGEFDANEKHLTKLFDLLPKLKPSECFYSGKQIEGGIRRKRRANRTESLATSQLLPLGLHAQTSI